MEGILLKKKENAFIEKISLKVSTIKRLNLFI